MTELKKAKRLLQHQVNNNKVSINKVYTLIMNKPIKRKMYKQSEWLHDNFYSGELNYIAHLYMEDPNRN